MVTKVTMPLLGESVLEGTISKWLVKEGERVQEFDPLLEVNTDKVDTEIPSPANGVLLRILSPEGEVVKVGAALALIGAPEELTPEGAVSGEIQISQETTGSAPEVVATTEKSGPGLPPVGRDRDLGFISPVVAKIASEQGVDLYQVKGTGQGGRITKKDILAFIEHSKVLKGSVSEPGPILQVIHTTAIRPSAPVPPPTGTQPPEAIPGEVVTLTPVRRAIADHMVLSKHTSPHVTTVMEADLSQVTRHRETNKAVFARDGVNLTFTPYFITAIISALKAYPIVNSSWSEAGIIIHREINIGMATSLGEGGLIVPVIKNADGLSLLGLARAVNDLSNRARAKQLKPDEVKGGSFTLTNHGISGSLFATPIINQPQCGILGVGAIQKRAVVINDAIAIRPMVYISLTFDHRILDGAIADYFLAKAVESLQNWSESS